VATMERYVPATGTFVPAGGLEARRQGHTATRLQNDTVLVAGGSSQSWMTNNTAEVYDPAVALAISPITLPDGQPNVTYPGITFTATGGAGPPYQIAQVSGTLPDGIIYDANSFLLSGTPTAIGTFAFGMRVTDSAGHSNHQGFP